MTKKKLKTKKKEQSGLSRVLASSRHGETVRRNFFSKLEPREIRDSVSKISKHHHFISSIQLAKTNFSDAYVRLTPDADLGKNIAWCLALLEIHAADIQQFLIREQEIEWCLLNDDTEQSIKLLDQIDAICGISLWSIGLRGSILSHSGRHAEKQEFLQRLNQASGANSFFKCIAALTANKYEAGDILSVESDFSEQKIKRTYTGNLLHFLMYKLLPLSAEFKYDFKRIINYEKNSTAIDILKCLQDYVVFHLAGAASDGKDEYCLQIIRSLSKKFKTPTTQAIAGYYGLEQEWKFIPKEYELLDFYTRGEYQEFNEALKETQLLNKFSIFHLAAQSICRHSFEVNGLLGKLLTWTSNLFVKSDELESSSSSLAHMVSGFGMLPWFRALHLLHLKETKYISTDSDRNIENAYVIVSDLNSPIKAKIFPENLKFNYLKIQDEAIKGSCTINLFKYLESNDSNNDDLLKEVDGARKEKYLALKEMKRGSFDSAITRLSDLIASQDKLIAFDACKLITQAYLLKGNIEAAITTFVVSTIKNPRLLGGINTAAICQACEIAAAQSNSIFVPIAISLHTRYVNDNFSAALKYSFECFLINNNLQNPIELFSCNQFNEEHINYFMEHVCTPEVMKLYLYFDTVKEIDACRIEICKKLIERGHSIEAMRYEVKERTRRLVIHDATKHVENSRIYSDTSSFPTSSDFKQLFDRYAKLRLNDYSEAADEQTLLDFYHAIKNVGETDIMESAHAIHVQDLVLNEKNLAFMKLLKLIRDEFTFGPKGLSGYLSTRIKHGHFPTTLRKCAADEGLISPKVTATGSYKKNSYWLERFDFLQEGKLTELDKAFSDFSSKFDELINNANDKWLKTKIIDQDLAGVRLEMLEDEAAFNYSISYFESFILQNRLSNTLNYSEFIKNIIEWLWTRTEYNLGRVREKIAAHIRENAFRLLDQLESDVLGVIKDHNRIAIFNDSVGRARAKLTSSIETIIGWFSRSQGLTVAQFDSDIALEIARLSAGAEINYKDSTGLQFQGRTLTYFVDILYVLLDNCVTKSNLAKDSIMIQGSLRKYEDSIALIIENNCAPIIDVLQQNANLSFYRNHYGNEAYMIKASQGMGGTGLFKIWKALSKDLDLDHTIEFGYSSPTSFKVELIINQISKVTQP